MDDDGRRWRAGEVSKSLVTCSPCPRIEDVTSPWNVRHGSSSTSPPVHCPLLVRAGLRGLAHPRTSWYILPSAASVAFTRRYTAFSAPCGRTVRETTVRETRWVPVRARRVSHTTSLPPSLPPTGALPLPYDIHNVCLFTRPSALPLTAYEFQLEYVLSAPN